MDRGWDQTVGLEGKRDGGEQEKRDGGNERKRDEERRE